jgi:hypothetical protein
MRSVRTATGLRINTRAPTVAQRKGQGQAEGVVIDLAQVLADSVGLRKLA